jgi:CBS domain-containing protein
MPSSAADAIAASTVAALREHAPFDEMEAESLRFIADHAALAYYSRSTVIVGPTSGEVDRLYIVKQGQVRGSGTLSEGPSADVHFGAGECFPVGALIGRRATVYEYRAESDVFCWELRAEHFHSLLERSKPLQTFCTNHLAALVDRAHRVQQALAAGALSDHAGMLAPLRSALARPVVTCPPETSIREVLKLMRAQRIGSMVISGADQVPLGILTTVDVLEKIAEPQTNVDAPVASVMTPHPVTLEEEATLVDAAVMMARYGIRHVIVTRDGRPTGVVSERDLFARQRTGLRSTAERIHAAQSADELVATGADIRALAHHLLARGVGAEQLTAMVSALNDALTRRLIDLCARDHALEGSWCWIALGSEGRMEQTLVTDQDNALILSGPGKDRFPAFADEVNRALDAAGFPLCKGDIMARNPRWCLSSEEWRKVFEGWIRNPLPEALLNASIFFDFRPLAGEARLAGDLREDVLALTKANPAFLRALTGNALQSAPPLGLLGDFSSEELDLKGAGARIFVDAARVLALAEGIAETSTARRLRAREELRATDAFHFIQGMRLRHGNRLNVAGLSRLERRVLKESLREAALLQQRIRMDFQL